MQGASGGLSWAPSHVRRVPDRWEHEIPRPGRFALPGPEQEAHPALGAPGLPRSGKFAGRVSVGAVQGEDRASISLGHGRKPGWLRPPPHRAAQRRTPAPSTADLPPGGVVPVPDGGGSWGRVTPAPREPPRRSPSQREPTRRRRCLGPGSARGSRWGPGTSSPEPLGRLCSVHVVFE